MTGIGENTLAQPVKPPLRERRACLAKLVKNRLTLTLASRLPVLVIPPRRSVSPLERSDGTSPHQLAKAGAVRWGEGNSLLLRRAFEGAVVEAARRAAANYTLAVPQFYGGRIQLLLPLCLTGDKPELALTIQREDGFYAARTCLTLEMAYNNARLICRPETSWIKR